MDCELIQYVVNKDIIPLYIDSAKIFMSLSSGALALTLTFRERIIGIEPGASVGRYLMASWLSFLLCITSSAMYQYFGVKFLDSVSCFPGKIQFFEYLVRNPGKVYGAMLVFFVLGAFFLVVSSWKQLGQSRG